MLDIGIVTFTRLFKLQHSCTVNHEIFMLKQVLLVYLRLTDWQENYLSIEERKLRADLENIVYAA